MAINQIVMFVGGMLLTQTLSSIFEAGGEKVSLATDIQFTTDSGTASANETVYVVETYGTSHPVTAVLKTDVQGRVSLRGTYCLPAIIAVRGGGVTLQKSTLKPSYSVTVRTGAALSLEKSYGSPRSGFYGRADCG